MRGHVLVLLRVLEAIAAVGRVDALEVQVAAALAGRLAIALDLAALALVARQRDVSRAARLAARVLRAIVGLALGAVWVARAVVVLRVGVVWLLVLLEMLLLLLVRCMLLLLAELAVGVRGDLSQAMRRIHGCRARLALY